ncbi:MAG: alpha/beta hydrolase fold domain-containing protein [Alphaproteobacteria bacterium]|nr:alpha/beta hydrolase fold domain-containing protein [Alphaproteobacteria bacterium]
MARTPLTISQEFSLAWTRVYSSAFTGASDWFQGIGSGRIKSHTYGTHPDECLDIMEASESSTAAPVVFIHGGGWTMGRKESYQADLEPIRLAGRTVYNIEYPKAPDHPHPYMLKSIFKALAWLKREQGAEYVHLVGDSAGGTLSIMAALVIANPGLRHPIEPIPARPELPEIVSVSSLYGVLDRHSCFDDNVPGGSAMIAAYGGQQALSQTVDADHAITPMDVTFKNHPPCFIAAGSDDPLRRSSEIYKDRLAGHGHSPTFKIYDGAAHGFLSWHHSPQREELLNDILAFIGQTETT